MLFLYVQFVIYSQNGDAHVLLKNIHDLTSDLERTYVPKLRRQIKIIIIIKSLFMKEDELCLYRKGRKRNIFFSETQIVCMSPVT